MKYIRFIPLAIASIFCTVCSCVTGAGETAAQILGGSSDAPMFLSCRAVSETEIDFQFSKPVTVVSLHFSPVVEVGDIENGSTVRVNFTGGPGPGEKLTVDILAEDEKGNTINALIPLRTRNSRVPRLLINELRTEYSKPKCEFIEFKTLEAGNMGALRVFIAGNYKAPLAYEFPSVEVKSGEYIVLHLRTTEDTNRDELGSSLEVSGGADSSAAARDLWIPGSSKLLHKTDAVYIMDQDDQIIDAIMLSENKDPWWGKDYFTEAAELLSGSGAWKSAEDQICSPADAFQSTGTTLTRTICRDESRTENSRSAADWYITASSSATPGRPNNPKRYN